MLRIYHLTHYTSVLHPSSLFCVQELALVRYDTSDSSGDDEETSDNEEDSRPVQSPTDNHFKCAGSTDQADVKGKSLITEITPPKDDNSHGNRRKLLCTLRCVIGDLSQLFLVSVCR